MQELFKKLVDDVMAYESDTFSAEGSEITRDEAEHVVTLILKMWWESRLDGVVIDNMLNEVRSAEETKHDKRVEEAEQAERSERDYE